MSWYNSLSDLTHDITNNARHTLDPLGYATKQTGHNENSLTDRFNTAKPLVEGAAVGAGADMLTGAGGASGAGGGTGAPQDTQGWLQKLLGGVTGGDLLRAGGSAVGAGLSAYDAAKQREEQKREFDARLAQQGQEFGRTQGDIEAQQAVRAASELNRVPLADKSQDLLLARLGAPPTAFQPRDFTKGGDISATLNTPATGGPADSLAADRAAAAAYTPGAGGVDDSTLRLLIAKLRGGSTAPLNQQQPYQSTPPAVTTAPGSTPSIYRTQPRVGGYV